MYPCKVGVKPCLKLLQATTKMTSELDVENFQIIKKHNTGNVGKLRR